MISSFLSHDRITIIRIVIQNQVIEASGIADAKDFEDFYSSQKKYFLWFYFNTFLNLHSCPLPGRVYLLKS